MSIDEKDNRHGFLFDFLAKANEGEGIDVVRLRDEIRKKIEAADKPFSKFLELMESFQDILPKEKQRYNVAIKALLTTSGINRQNVLESTDNQLEEVKILEKEALSAFTGFRDELKTMESRSKEIKGEIAKLREKIMTFEKEDQEILLGMAARERDLNVIEDGVRKVFTDVGAEITEIRNKIEQFTGEKVSSRQIAPPESIKSHKREDEAEISGIRNKIEEFTDEKVFSRPITPSEFIESHKREDEREVIEEESKIEETSGPQDTEEKVCTMCGGYMTFLSNELLWKCYSCGLEELKNDDTESASEFTTAKDLISALEPAPTSSNQRPSAVPSTTSPSVKRPSPGKKTCPVCDKPMNMHEDEQIWQCPFCDYRIKIF
jgi:ribosomal protein L37AE/L43A